MPKSRKSRYSPSLRRSRRLVMDKVAERIEQQCDLFADILKDLVELLVIDENRATEQIEINKRRRALLGKLEQIDAEHLDLATIAKLYKFMAEADGVQLVPMTYPAKSDTVNE